MFIFRPERFYIDFPVNLTLYFKNQVKQAKVFSTRTVHSKNIFHCLVLYLTHDVSENGSVPVIKFKVREIHTRLGKLERDSFSHWIV